MMIEQYISKYYGITTLYAHVAKVSIKVSICHAIRLRHSHARGVVINPVKNIEMFVNILQKILSLINQSGERKKDRVKIELEESKM